MSFENVHTKEMSLILSQDAKPRLKWTQELHQQFIDAVNQLGGPEKATPKSLMRVMDVQGLTLYHLKSHLQKYRLGRSQQTQTHHQNKQEDFEENPRSQPASKNCDGKHEQINESVQIAQALQMQMEVQRKLHEQIEVQKHLQLRIESQGKYLQLVLNKAQETLFGYSSCSIEVERASAQLSQLVSMVDSVCLSPSFSVLTESEGSMLRDASEKQLRSKKKSMQSSLTSSENSGSEDETEGTHVDDHYNTNHDKKRKRKFVEISLNREMNPSEKSRAENPTTKRSINTIEEVNLLESRCVRGKRLGLLENIDLNCKVLNDFESGPNFIDLNHKGVEF